MITKSKFITPDIDTAHIKMMVGVYITIPADGTIEESIEQLFEAMEEREALPIIITLPCCHELFTYRTIEEFPRETIPCPCGAEGRYIVKYGEEKDTPYGCDKRSNPGSG